MKRILALLALALLLLTLSPAVLASEEQVIDQADIFSAKEEAKLSEMVQILIDEYQMDIVLLTVESLEGKSSQDYADDYYDYNGYGIGDDYSGLILVFSTGDRDYALSTCGSCIQAIDDNDVDDLLDGMYPYMVRGDYYRAFVGFLEDLEPVFQAYQKSIAPPGVGDYMMVGVISLAIGAVAGFIGLMMLRSGMNTVKPVVGAQSYLANNSFMLPVNQNTFLYTRTSRMRIQQSSSSGGGSSTHRSSSGRSHGGGSRRF